MERRRKWNHRTRRVRARVNRSPPCIISFLFWWSPANAATCPEKVNWARLLRFRRGKNRPSKISGATTRKVALIEIGSRLCRRRNESGKFHRSRFFWRRCTRAYKIAGAFVAVERPGSALLPSWPTPREQLKSAFRCPINARRGDFIAVANPPRFYYRDRLLRP